MAIRTLFIIPSFCALSLRHSACVCVCEFHFSENVPVVSWAFQSIVLTTVLQLLLARDTRLCWMLFFSFVVLLLSRKSILNWMILIVFHTNRSTALHTHKKGRYLRLQQTTQHKRIGKWIEHHHSIEKIVSPACRRGGKRRITFGEDRQPTDDVPVCRLQTDPWRNSPRQIDGSNRVLRWSRRSQGWQI